MQKLTLRPTRRHRVPATMTPFPPSARRPTLLSPSTPSLRAPTETFILLETCVCARPSIRTLGVGIPRLHPWIRRITNWLPFLTNRHPSVLVARRMRWSTPLRASTNSVLILTRTYLTQQTDGTVSSWYPAEDRTSTWHSGSLVKYLTLLKKLFGLKLPKKQDPLRTGYLILAIPFDKTTHTHPYLLLVPTKARLVLILTMDTQHPILLA